MTALLILTLSCFAIAPGAQEMTNPDSFVTVLDDVDIQFDPHRSIFTSEAQIFTAIYEGLFAYDPSSLDPVKALCQSYSRSADGRTYTFILRENAAWSDGSPILTSDFRNSWIRAMDPATKAEYSSFFDIIVGAKDFRTGKSTDTASIGIKVLSDRKMEIRLDNPAPWFTRLLCHHAFAPVHQSMFPVTNWKKAIPFPVSGPYTFLSYSPGRLELVANPHYWDKGSLGVDRLTFLLTDDDKEASRMFDDGEAHWLAGPMDLDALLSGNSIMYNSLFATNYWFFSSAIKPWNDARVRRALALLLPWESLRSKDNYPMPATTLVLPLGGYEGVAGIEKQDKSTAMTLLAEAGFPEGKGLPGITILSPSGKDSRRVSGVMKSSWENLSGLKVTIRTVPASDYFSTSRKQVRTGEITLAQSTWIGDFADPLAFLQLWISDSNLNDSGYNDAGYDSLIASSSSAIDGDRFELLKKAETKLLEEAVVLPMYHGLSINVIDVDYIRGWYTNPLDIHPYKHIRFGERQIRSNVASMSIDAESAISLAAIGHGDSE